MNRIKELRLENEIKQIDLAKKLGIAQNTLSTWESGKHEPDIHALVELASLFDVSVDYLLGVSEERKSSAEAEDKEIDERLNSIFRALSPERKERILDVILAMYPDLTLKEASQFLSSDHKSLK